MLEFVTIAFRKAFGVILWINLILWVVVGGVFGYELESVFLGLIIGVVVGMLLNIVGGGLIATFLNMEKHLDTIHGINVNIERKLEKVVNSNVTPKEEHQIEASQLSLGCEKAEQNELSSEEKKDLVEAGRKKLEERQKRIAENKGKYSINS